MTCREMSQDLCEDNDKEGDDQHLQVDSDNGLSDNLVMLSMGIDSIDPTSSNVRKKLE